MYWKILHCKLWWISRNALTHVWPTFSMIHYMAWLLLQCVAIWPKHYKWWQFMVLSPSTWSFVWHLDCLLVTGAGDCKILHQSLPLIDSDWRSLSSSGEEGSIWISSILLWNLLYVLLFWILHSTSPIILVYLVQRFWVLWHWKGSRCPSLNPDMTMIGWKAWPTVDIRSGRSSNVQSMT